MYSALKETWEYAYHRQRVARAARMSISNFVSD